MSGEPAGRAATAGVAVEPIAERLRRLPDARLAALWLGLAHACLLVALLVVARTPALLAGSFWSPPLLAAVHLVTVGCITATILGALPLVAAMALRARVPRRRLDFAAWAIFAAATAVLAAGFWLGRYELVVPAGLAALAAAVWVLVNVLLVLRGARVPAGVRRHFPLALGGLVVAVLLGVLVAIDRVQPFLPGAFYGKGFAHAHLAVLGWVLPIVFGSAYRLLPMLLPAGMPAGRAVAASGPLALGAGLLLAAGLLADVEALRLAGAIAAVAAIACFVATVLGMVRDPRPRPPARPRPDLPLLHVAGAVLALPASAALGALLLLRGEGVPPGWRAAYGVLALLGVFVQLIVGVSQRLVAWLSWLVAYTRSEFRDVPPTPYALMPRPLQLAVAVAWLAGVPLLAAGAALPSEPEVRGGAALLAGGALLNALLLGRALLRARAGAPAGGAEGSR